MNGNSIRHFFLPFEIHIMVKGGGHETLHAAKMAQNGKNSFLSQKSQYFLLHLAWKGFFFSGGCLVHCVGGRWGLGPFSGVWEGSGRGFSLVGVTYPLSRWEMGIGAVFGGLGGLEGVFL